VLSALMIVVPRAVPLVDGWRERTVNDKPSLGVPPHVTLLFPFVPPERLDNQVLLDLRELFAGFDPFGFTLPKTGRFPTTLYLEPVPSGPFVELTKAICERFPDVRPYEGEFDEIVPHLTVAQGEPELLDAAEREIAPRLPLTSRATEVTLLETKERFGQQWGVKASFPLGRRR
jgi:2'-5' RNA ligase